MRRRSGLSRLSGVTITDETGIVVERMSFDAFGKRRDHDWVPVNDPTGYLSRNTTRGSTAHEQIDSVGLIHMNGRVFDPEIGRFTSADPIIQDPYLTQSLNRYLHVLSNPLSYTDPTGFRVDPLKNESSVGQADHSDSSASETSTIDEAYAEQEIQEQVAEEAASENDEALNASGEPGFGDKDVADGS